MTTRDMKSLRRGVIILGILLFLAAVVNAHCDQGLRSLQVPHG